MTACCICFTGVRWFYDKKGLCLKNWMKCAIAKILWYLSESFSAIQLPAPSLHPPFISILCKPLAEAPRALERSWQRLKLHECLAEFLCGNLEGWQETFFGGICSHHFMSQNTVAPQMHKGHVKMSLYSLRAQISCLLHLWSASVVFIFSAQVPRQSSVPFDR